MQMRIAQYHLQLGNLTACKKLVEGGKETLETLSDVRIVQHGGMHALY